MATTLSKPGKGEPAKQVAIDILRKAAEPLHANEIAKRVIASGRCSGLKGKTPEATISAMLAVGCKPGGPFSRVGKGTYVLAAATAGNKSTPTERPAARKTPAHAGKPARAQQKRVKSASKRGAAQRTR